MVRWLAVVVEVREVKNVVLESEQCLIWWWSDLDKTWCGCEDGRYSNCDLGSLMDEGQSHVYETPDGGQKLVHEGDDVLQDVSDEKCLHDGRCQLGETSGDEICVACHGPDNEVGYVETCQHEKVTVVER